jgi:predicted GNAT family acetyltransferase
MDATDGGIEVLRADDANAFLTATSDFRAAEPAMTNVIGSVATAVLAGRVYESELWLVVVDQAGVVIGCAMRTAPWHLTLSPMPDAAALAVGRYAAAADPDLPGLNGPRAAVTAALRGMSAEGRARVDMVDTVRVLGTYRPPPETPGAARPATEADRDLLLHWFRLFAQDAGLSLHDLEGALDAQLGRSASWLWEVDGEPVAMAGHAPLVDTPAGVVARIGPVFTPAARRGRGYGSAITAAVTERLLPGCTTLMLLADAEKPQNNRIYARLGYEEVAEIIEVVLD